MQSYDIGCSYSGGADPGSVLTEAGLSFVTNSQSKWKKSKCGSLFYGGVTDRDQTKFAVRLKVVITLLEFPYITYIFQVLTANCHLADRDAPWTLNKK